MECLLLYRRLGDTEAGAILCIEADSYVRRSLADQFERMFRVAEAVKGHGSNTATVADEHNAVLSDGASAATHRNAVFLSVDVRPFDFAGEVMEALRAADAAIIVCSAKDGISVVILILTYAMF